jgi:DNA-binding XRE family transcriptional regulator
MELILARHNLARLRHALSLSQKEFGRLINRSEITVKAIETGRLELSKKLAKMVADITGADAEWLLHNDLREPMPALKYNSATLQPADLAYDCSCILLQHLFERLFVALGRLEPSESRKLLESLIQVWLDDAKTFGHEPKAKPLKPVSVGVFEFFRKNPQFLDTDLASWINLNFLIKDSYRVEKQIKAFGFPLPCEPAREPAKPRRRSTPGRTRASPESGGQRKSRRSSANQRDASPN